MPCRESLHTARPMAPRCARQIRPATATREVVFLPMFSPPWQRGLRRSYTRALVTGGNGTVARCSSSMVRASRCRTHPRTKRCIRSRPINSRGSAFLSPGSRYCYRWRPVLATIWPSRRTQARAPEKRASSDASMTPSDPAMWCWPTPCSTITSSPANCAIAGSTSLPMRSTSGREVAR
jgi:hypothetical protein